MKVTLSPECIKSLEEITGEKITRNADQVIREVAEIAENTQKPNSPCWIESNCSEEDESK